MAKKKNTDQDAFKEVVEKVWPKTKKELEKAMKNTKEVLSRGETYLKNISEMSVENTRRLSVTLKREQYYYALGKLIAKTTQSKWGSDKKIMALLRSIKKLDKELSKKTKKK